MKGQLDFLELLKTPLEKATSYKEVMMALGDKCVQCYYDKMGTCCCPMQCVLDNQFKPK